MYGDAIMPMLKTWEQGVGRSSRLAPTRFFWAEPLKACLSQCRSIPKNQYGSTSFLLSTGGRKKDTGFSPEIPEGIRGQWIVRCGTREGSRCAIPEGLSGPQSLAHLSRPGFGRLRAGKPGSRKMRRVLLTAVLFPFSFAVQTFVTETMSF